jgi:hydrogenase maturation protein HypF
VFDGVAALLGLGTGNSFEAQAALALEAAAAVQPLDAADATPPRFEIRDGMISLAPFYRFLLSAVQAGGSDGSALAAMFHRQFARAWDAAVAEAVTLTGLNLVVLSGGVFCNQRLTLELTALLERRGCRVLRHRLVPPGDGGLALGQAAVAAARMNVVTGGPEFRGLNSGLAASGLSRQEPGIGS